MYKFWMVIRETGSTSDRRHNTHEEAKAEAARLCRKEHRPFFVLEAVEAVDVAEVPLKWEETLIVPF